MATFGVDWNTQESKREAPSVQLWYPRLDGSAKEIEVELCDVRAADSILVRYDFERDGWSILQAAVFSWPTEDTVRDPEWKEVAFVKAWARARDELG